LAFSLRFQSGDIYPAYSSFRADPLGTKALYESFNRLLAVEQNFKPLLRMESGRDTAFLCWVFERTSCGSLMWK